MKKFIFPALLLVAAMSSCSKNEVTEVLPQGDNANLLGITVSSGLTKGVDVTTLSLENNKNVKLYAVKEDGTSKVANFTFASDDWSSTDAPTWTELGIPGETVKFYSVHDGDGPKALDVSDTDAGAQIAQYPVAEESVDHKDLVYYAGSLAGIPAGGKIQAYHKHALSKVNILASTGDYKVYIARVRLVNLDNNADAAMSANNKILWSNNETFDSKHHYYTDKIADDETVATQFASGVIKAVDTNPDIMMIPQELVATCKADINDDRGDSYVEVIYCAEDKDGNPLVGYTAASKYLDFVNIDNANVTEDTPLYVKAAFPVGYNFMDNKAYTITLGLGGLLNSTGGLNLSDNFVDKDGNEIDLGTKTDPDLPKEGDPLFPDADNAIDIMVKVCKWDDILNIQVD